MSYPDTRGDWRKWEKECADVEPKAYGAPLLSKLSPQAQAWPGNQRFASTADLDMRDRYTPDEDYYRDYFEESGY